ncbi:electron transport complex subunit C [Spirochaetia bacterium]|nr:electron transport complex subunit C [Spirochaetia bacterium]
MRTYSFPQGGIFFDDPAVPPKNSSVIAFLPGISVIPLLQHTGSRAYPVVSVGDYVKEGMLIGRGWGLGSANIHATVPGRVIRMVSWKMAEGQTNDALVIRMEGSFERLGKREDVFPWKNLSPSEIQRLILEAGIVEMEGEGRPVQDMLSSLRSVNEPVTLVVRCVFDDPWLAADQVLCRDRLKAVVEGAMIAARACRAKHIVFAVSHGEEDLGKQLLAEAETRKTSVYMVLVGSRYPQRNRRELELALRMYEKKEGQHLGALFILGPATLAAIHDAVILKKPILDRYVAVGGSAVKNPQVMKVRIGTRIGDIFAECGGFVDTPRRIATGSPFLGRAVVDLDEPVIKTSFAVFAILGRQAGVAASRNCIGCGECRTVCPIGLDPEDLYKRANAAAVAPAFAGVLTAADSSVERASECHGCGCCEMVCPSHLPLSAGVAASAGREN